MTIGRHLLRLVLSLFFTCLFVACLPSRAEEPPVAATLAGCLELHDRSCELEIPGRLRIRIEGHEKAVFTAVFEGREAAPARRASGGWLIEVPVEPGDKTLTLKKDGRSNEVWTVRAPPRSPNMVLIDELASRGENTLARALLETAAQHGTTEDRARALSKLARQHIASGDAERALRELREAASTAASIGRRTQQRREILTTVYVLLYNGRRFAEARMALAEQEKIENNDPELDVAEQFYRAALDFEAGDLRSALRSFRAVERSAEEIAADRFRFDALQMQAQILQALGRDKEARETLSRVLDAAPNPCVRGDALLNLGWTHLLERESSSTGASSSAVYDVLIEAAEIYSSACESAPDLRNVFVNLALGHVQEQNTAAAQHWLDRARKTQATPDPRVEAWMLDIDARLAALRADHRTALARYGDLARLATEAFIPEARWRAAFGAAQSLEQIGDTARAGDAYRRAERLLVEESASVPIGEGRQSYFSRFRKGTEAQLNFLVSTKQLKEAAELARRSRARLISWLSSKMSVELLDEAQKRAWETELERYHRLRREIEESALATWQLSPRELEQWRSKDHLRRGELASQLEESIAKLSAAQPREEALRSPRPNELFLIYHRTSAGWVAFALTSDDISAADLQYVGVEAPREQIARLLLEPFRSLIDRAEMIRIIAPPELEQLDFHNLPYAGQPLIVQLPVSYGVDLSASDEPGPDAPTSALVVGDPTLDLPGARNEAEAVIAALSKSKVRVHGMVGEQARRERFLQLIAEEHLDLFHYAGHGELRGADGWASKLPLAQGLAIELGDILVMKRVPETVILSGCETSGRGSGLDGQLGVAEAFLAAGADQVLASTRKVPDRLSGRIMQRVYAAGTFDLSAGLRAAQLEIMREEEGDWSAYRVITR